MADLGSGEAAVAPADAPAARAAAEFPGATARHEGAASTAAAAAASIALTRHDIRFKAITDAAYHAMREAFFGRMHRVFMAAVLVAGTASVAEVLGVGTQATKIAAILVVVASMIYLIFDLPGRARVHARLRSRYHQVLARLETCGDADLRAIQAEMQTIYAEEPPSHRAIQALAFNAAVDALYGDPAARTLRLVVPPFDRIAGMFVRFAGTAYESAERRVGA